MSSRITILPFFLSLLFVLCSTSPIHMHEFSPEEADNQATSGRSVHYGDWVIHREIFVDDGCRSYYGSDYLITATSTLDMLAIYSEGCDDETGDVIVYNTHDLSLLHTIQNSDSLRDVMFSPDGQYLALRSPETFSVVETATWTEVVSQSRSTGDNFFFNSVTWSGDSTRVIVATGNNGGHMYEAPDWNEVEGASSTGILVTHHPSEEKIWYVGSDGSGNVYEYQDVPLAGKRWVLTRSFTIQSPVYDLAASPDGDALIANDGSSTYVYTTNDYTLSDTIQYTTGEAKFSHDGTSFLQTIGSYSTGDIGIYSTMDWDFERDLDVSYGNKDASFSANDSEIFVLISGGYDTTKLVGYMPDQDEDGVDDSKDQCPETPPEEESNTSGCSSSQRDTDGDGINDKFDDCPRTKDTSSVDARGCSVSQLLDSDGDGIADSDDVCPDSAANSKTDRNGCSSVQRDTDGDGLSDESDECPLDAFNDCPENILWDFNGTHIENSKDYGYLEFAPNGDFIAARKSPSYGDVFVMDKDLSVVYTIYAPGDYYFNDYEWSPDSQELLLTISNDDSECEFQTWNVQTQVLSELQMFLSDCRGVRADSTTYSHDGNMVVLSAYNSGYRVETILLDSSMQSILLQDSNFAPSMFQFSRDGGWLFGGDGSQIIVWDAQNYEFVETRAMRGSDTMQLTSDGGHFLLHSDEEIMTYSAAKLITTTTIAVTENDSEIIDIQFSKNQRMIYVTVLLEYCSWGCDDGQEGATTILKTYSIDGGNLSFLAESEVYRSSDVVAPLYHPDEEVVLIKPGRNDNYISMTKDSDGDGFNNSVDACPLTDIQWVVDETGCSEEQLDDDGDGVANFVDLCVDSPAGVSTDENGCTEGQVDEDFDGICNDDAPSDGPSDCTGEDKCPGTSTGVSIDSNGCSWAQQDSDGDGVNNGNDLCEYTEIPGDADANGCDRKQRDSDQDSINDYWDACEATAIGAEIDNSGCSDLQVDTDMDLVCNRDAPSQGPSNCTSIDTCPNTVLNESVDENGCSWNQRDDDMDGIFNKFDLCPNTLADSVAPNGCSAWQMDSDGDGVYDANDECANTDANQVANAKGCSDEQYQLKGAGSDENSLTSNMLVWVAGVVVVVLIGLILMRRRGSDVFEEAPSIEYPQYATRGAMRDGMEWIEYPSGSQQWFYRDPSTQQWVHRK